MDQPNSPVNTINVNMQDEFASVLDQIENDANIRAAVLISKKSTCFVAGADIDMINKVIKKKNLNIMRFLKMVLLSSFLIGSNGMPYVLECFRKWYAQFSL